MIKHGTGRRLRLTAGAAVLLLALTACATGGGEPQQPDPSTSEAAPTAAAETTAPAETEAPSAEEPASDDGLVMDASAPVTVSVASIDLTAELMQTGIRDDGTLEVPPGHEGAPASWYTGSPTPGERGASVLLGQVNSLVDDSGVFYDLQRMQEGDRITVEREDGSTAIFEVYKIESFDKDEFPTRAVYYPVPDAELRLITCQTGDDPNVAYPNNLVVFAKLVEAA